MKSLFNKLNNNSVLAGIIGTGLFIYFIQPILEFVGRLVIVLYKSVSGSLYNRVFEEMAMGKPDYSFTILLLYAGFLTGALFMIMLSTIVPPKKDKHQEDTEKQIKKINPVFGKILSVLSFVVILGFMAISYVKYSYIQSFEQRIRIVTPYIDSSTKDKLISDFSLMKDFEDYKRIIDKIEMIASTNDLDLPKTKIHWF